MERCGQAALLAPRPSLAANRKRTAPHNCQNGRFVQETAVLYRKRPLYAWRGRCMRGEADVCVERPFYAWRGLSVRGEAVVFVGRPLYAWGGLSMRGNASSLNCDGPMRYSHQGVRGGMNYRRKSSISALQPASRHGLLRFGRRVRNKG